MNTPEQFDRDRDATTDEGIFQECAERLKIAADAESQNRIDGLEAIQFRELGEQWDADIANERKINNRPALTINHTDVNCSRVENTLRQQRPRIKCHPVGGGARIEDAQVVNGLIRHIETLSNASVAYDKAAKSALNIGWGYCRIVSRYIDPKSFDQELQILPVSNTFTVYMDPSAVMPAGEDQRWCIISEKMKRREYKLKYPKADNCEWRGGDAPGDMSLDWENKEEIRLAEYYRIHETPDTLYLMSDGRAWLKSELPDEATMAASGWTFALGPDGKPISRPTARTEVQWFRLNGKTIIDRRVIPGRYIPVLRCEGNMIDVNGRIVRKGMVKGLMDPARMFNYWRTSETERYALAPKAPWVMAEGQDDGHPEWDNANQHSYSRLVYKPVKDDMGNALPPPMRQPPLQIEAGMAQAAQGAYADFQAVSGMPTEVDQQRIVSGNKYLQRRQGIQDLTHYQYYDNQTYMIMWVGIILLELIPHYYDTERMQRIIGEDGTPQMVKINAKEQDAESSGIYNVKNNLQLGRYDVIMDTGPNYVTKREEDAEKTIDALGTPLGEPMVKVGSDIIARNLGMEEMADRLAPTTPKGMEKAIEGMGAQGKAIVTSLQQQIQTLEQTVQQQALEIKYKGGIEAAKLETTLKTKEMDDKTKRYDIEVDATTRRDVAEIGAAAQLLNSQHESKHEEKMADRMIAKGVE